MERILIKTFTQILSVASVSNFWCYSYHQWFPFASGFTLHIASILRHPKVLLTDCSQQRRKVFYILWAGFLNKWSPNIISSIMLLYFGQWLATFLFVNKVIVDSNPGKPSSLFAAFTVKATFDFSHLEPQSDSIWLLGLPLTPATDSKAMTRSSKTAPSWASAVPLEAAATARAWFSGGGREGGRGDLWGADMEGKGGCQPIDSWEKTHLS